MTRNLFNLITAWLSVVLLILVAAIWVLRVLVQKKIVSKESFIYKSNRVLRIHHKTTGVLFLTIALIHGLLSSAELFSFNWGSISYFFIAIMGVSYFIKKKLNRKIWVNLHRILTIAVVITFIVHIADVGIAGLNLLKVPAASLEEYELTQMSIDDLQIETAESGQTDTTEQGTVYADGVFTGVADGYGPNLTVEVTILNNTITDVTVVSHNEVSRRYWETAVEEIPQAIVESQCVQVDSISGATYTSVGIKNAVLDALSQAITSGQLPEEEIVSDYGKHGHGHR